MTYRNLKSMDDREVARKHIMRDFSIQGMPIDTLYVSGEGCWIITQEGRRLLDFGSSLFNMNLGYQHPGLIQALKDQADQLCSTNQPNLAEIALTRTLFEKIPENLTRVFYSTAGSEELDFLWVLNSSQANISQKLPTKLYIFVNRMN